MKVAANLCQSTLARLQREREEAERQADDEREKRDAEAAGMSVDQLRDQLNAESRVERLKMFARLKATIGSPSVMERAEGGAA